MTNLCGLSNARLQKFLDLGHVLEMASRKTFSSMLSQILGVALTPLRVVELLRSQNEASFFSWAPSEVAHVDHGAEQS